MNELAERLLKIRDEIDGILAELNNAGKLSRNGSTSEMGRAWAKQAGYPNPNQLPSTLSHTIFEPGPARTLSIDEMASWMESHHDLHWIIEKSGEMNLCGAGFRAACVRAKMAGVDTFKIHALIDSVYNNRLMPDGFDIAQLVGQLRSSTDSTRNYYLTAIALMEISTGTKRISQMDTKGFFDPFPLAEKEKCK